MELSQQSVGQSILVSGTHLGPAINFSFPLKQEFIARQRFDKHISEVTLSTVDGHLLGVTDHIH
jgi:hypothetical protein